MVGSLRALDQRLPTIKCKLWIFIRFAQRCAIVCDTVPSSRHSTTSLNQIILLIKYDRLACLCVCVSSRMETKTNWKSLLTSVRWIPESILINGVYRKRHISRYARKQMNNICIVRHPIHALCLFVVCTKTCRLSTRSLTFGMLTNDAFYE